MISEARQDDARYIVIRRGLNQLSTGQIKRLIRHLAGREPIVVDQFNYDADRKAWCPLAIALNVPEIVNASNIPCVSDADGKRMILEIGRKHRPDFSLNPISGVKGRFFTDNREQDLRMLCDDILLERNAA